ncbi:hypothetical protein PoB_001413500 [Plakobranchus ocellatus]|uniref:Mutator-like transposase domain-containing protein n=1 Tax=Plakobranchus ocellatus TaxID=259542 RepID=A0AAV3YXL0_9GAST|nr:hypothetical protein PoB_001413500 [Plakobranchus ocellatus]
MQCSTCNGNLQLREGQGSKGFAVHLQLSCIDCGEITNEVNTSTTTGRAYDVNRSMVASCLSAGMGHSGMQKLSDGLGLPGLHHKSYNTHVDAIFEKSSEVMEVILALSREKVLEFYR